DRGRELLARLVAESDVVVESFSPGVLGRWGFGYERLRELNAWIVLVSLPAVGSIGPWSHYVGYASTTEALAGLPALCGYAGGRRVAGSVRGDGAAGAGRGRAARDARGPGRAPRRGRRRGRAVDAAARPARGDGAAAGGGRRRRRREQRSRPARRPARRRRP